MGQNLGQALTQILTQTAIGAVGQNRTPEHPTPASCPVSLHSTASTLPIVFAASICAGVVTWV